MKVVADTNVIISMLLWGKSLKRLFSLVNGGRIILCFSPETIDEIFRVIHYPSIAKQVQKTKINAGALLDKLLAASLICYPDIKIAAIAQDDSDNRLLETAITAEVKCIISGDKHLLALDHFKTIPIYRPAKFMQTFFK